MDKLLKNKLELKEKLYKMYVVDEMSTLMIGKEINISYKKVYDWLKRLNIQTRNYKKANILSQKNNRNPGMKNKHHNKITKEILSKKSKEWSLLHLDKKLEAAKKGHKSCGRISKPEKFFKERLIKYNIEFDEQYEYKLGIADFYLPKINTIVEVDGDYWHNRPEVKARDKRQTEWLENNGYIVIRISDKNVNNFNMSLLKK